MYEEAIRDTIENFEATGSPVITDGEQRKYRITSERIASMAFQILPRIDCQAGLCLTLYVRRLAASCFRAFPLQAICQQFS